MMIFIKQTQPGQFTEIIFDEKNSEEGIKNYGDVIWVEIFNPTQSERDFIKQHEKVELPEHHELHQIEYSNQFYVENEAIFLTTNLVTVAYPYSENHAINILITKNKILTVRYSNPSPISHFLTQFKTRAPILNAHYDLLRMLLQAIVGANADILEDVGDRTNYLARTLSGGLTRGGLKKREARLNYTLLEINRLESLTSMCYQSLSGLEMLINYLGQTLAPKLIDFKPISRDLFSLLKQADYLNQKIVFQLDSTLGLINIEQMGIVKIFTVLAMVFMPPTLIASIYGMNFKHMPELDFILGYPLALCGIALSALFPWLIFRKKGWI